MSTVTLTIGPKSYSIACADGEEAQIEALGAMVAEKYTKLGLARAPLEAQNLLFAALFLADELTETRKQAAALADDAARLAASQERSASLEQQLAAAHAEAAALADRTREAAALTARLATLEQELEALRTAPPARAPAARADAPQSDLFAGPDPASDIADRLEAIAAQIEASATALEAATASA